MLSPDNSPMKIHAIIILIGRMEKLSYKRLNNLTKVTVYKWPSQDSNPVKLSPKIKLSSGSNCF